jgi:hypothetical protein
MYHDGLLPCPRIQGCRCQHYKLDISQITTPFIAQQCSVTTAMEDPSPTVFHGSIFEGVSRPPA